MYPGCLTDGHLTSFDRKDHFIWHLRLHMPYRKLWPCPVTGCNCIGDKGFPRKDKLKEHVKSHHSRGRLVAQPIRVAVPEVLFSNMFISDERRQRASTIEAISYAWYGEDLHATNAYDLCSIVEQTGKRNILTLPRNLTLKFTSEDGELFIKLKKTSHATWTPIAEFFPDRTAATLQRKRHTSLEANAVYTLTRNTLLEHMETTADQLFLFARMLLMLPKEQLQAVAFAAMTDVDILGRMVAMLWEGEFQWIDLAAMSDIDVFGRMLALPWKEELQVESLAALSDINIGLDRLLENATTTVEQLSIFGLMFAALCEGQLQAISLAAMSDIDIGPDRFSRESRRLMKAFWQDAHSLTRDSTTQSKAHGLQVDRNSAYLAQLIESHTRAHAQTQSARKSLRVPIAQVGTVHSRPGRNKEALARWTQYLLYAKSVFLASGAFGAYREDLLEFAHRPYEERILRSFSMATRIIDESGRVLDRQGIARVAQDVSWTPTTLFMWSHDRSLSVASRLKGLVEDSMGERWHWWPLGPRLRRLEDGFCRLSWQSVRPISAGLSSWTGTD